MRFLTVFATMQLKLNERKKRIRLEVLQKKLRFHFQWSAAESLQLAPLSVGRNQLRASQAHNADCNRPPFLRSLRGIRQLRRLCKVVNIRHTIQRWVNAVDRNRVFRGDYSVGNTLHDIAT